MELPEMRLARHAPFAAFRDGYPATAALFRGPIPVPELPETLFPDRAVISGRRSRPFSGDPAAR
ncbi:MAG: hypothetical protein ACRD4P_06475 [Bryobacteraceae bacterium]